MKNYIKIGIKINKMKTLNNKNQSKQKQTNILGNFNVPKLKNLQKNNALLQQSHKRNNRQSPVSMQSNRERNNSKNQVQSFTDRTTYIPSKNPQFEDPHFSIPNSARQGQKSRQENANLENIAEKKDINMVKKQIGSSQKKRFYYKEEYDSLLDGQKQLAKAKLSKISQSKTILPDYFAKINSRPPKIDDFDSNSQVASHRQKRSLSPLEESQQQLFAKCYKETSHHLQLMLKEIHESQDNLAAIHQEILETISDTVKQRASFIRSQLIEMVEGILNDWEENEWMFIEQNQILFIDDVFELKEQLHERELKVNSLIQRLETQRNQSWIVGDIPKTQSIWKNVTTDLLMFNYEDSIMEIQELSEKISDSIPQKCRKAIEILPSSQFQMTNMSKNISSDAFYQLKMNVMKTINEILNNNKGNPEYIRKLNYQRKYSETTEFTKRNPKRNLGF